MAHWNTRIGREVILVAAIKLAEQPGGWVRLTRAAIAAEAHCSPGLVSAHLGSMESLKGKLVKAAIKLENFDILIQALMAQNREAWLGPIRAVGWLLRRQFGLNSPGHRPQSGDGNAGAGSAGDTLLRCLRRTPPSPVRALLVPLADGL